VLWDPHHTENNLNRQVSVASPLISLGITVSGGRLRRLALLVLLAGILMPAAQSSVQSSDPQDIADEVFYHFMPICWRDSDNDTYRFGDFGGMIDSLDYLEALGITAVWMNPVFPSPAYHGYQHGPADQLNPWFGTTGDFTDFLEAAHLRGIKVFVDFVAYGISQDTIYFQDAYGHPNSTYDSWLAFYDQQNTDYQGSVYNTWNGDEVGFIHWDLRDPHPVTLVTDWAGYWLDPDGDGDFSDGLDGYRLDHVWTTYPYGPDGWGYHIDTFWAPWRDALRAVNPDVVVFAEQADWGSQGVDLLAGMDAAFTKPFEFGARDALRWEYAEPLYSQMAAAVAALGASSGEGTLMTTIGDHDVDRLATSIGDDFAKGKAAAAVLLTQPFPPVIYHGDEIGMRGAKNTSYPGDAADIPMREPFKWNAVAGSPMSNYDALNSTVFAGRIAQDNDGRSVQEQDGTPGSLLEAYRELIAARRSNIALRRGGYSPVPASGGAVWSFVRSHDDQQVLVVINVSGSYQAVELDLGSFSISGGSTTAVDLLTGISYPDLTDQNKDAYSLLLAPYGFLLLDVDVNPPAPPVVVVDGRDIPTGFGPGGLLGTQASPTHLGDNVSELDQMFFRVAGDSLFLGLTGNLATDGTGLAILFDNRAGGQNVLDLSNLSPPPAGPDLLTGLRLDDGFDADQMVFANAWAGTIYIDRYALITGGGAVKTYRGQGTVNSGNGLLTGGDNPNEMRVALDNSNTGGVTDTTVDQAATAVSGFEIYLPLADLGMTSDQVSSTKVAAFLLESDGLVSSQWLPPVTGIMGSLGSEPDLTGYPGDQFALLSSVSMVDNSGTGEGDGPLAMAVLNGANYPAGRHEIRWSGRDNGDRQVAAGLYIGLLEAGSLKASGKITLIR
jgi:glycosidase